jgi:dTDP-4-amino-4,6-dideoxygalactose transaminase
MRQGGAKMLGKEERDAVLRVIESGVLSGYRGSFGPWFYGGEEIKALEKEWAEYFHVKHAIACNSATSGLWLACAAIGLKPWIWNSKVRNYDPDLQEVIVSPYSMTCSASIPLHFGAMPVFADIEPDYFCLSPKSIESKITPNTKAIIAVDLFGQPYDADAINAIAKKHGIMVIEDAAQAAGAKYKGKYAGTLGDIGVYSLNVHKHVQCGEGGIIVTDNDDIAMQIRLYMNHAEAVVNDIFIKENGIPIHNGNWLKMAGMNMRMTELSAAISREQLKKLSAILAVYQENAKYFPIKARPECTSAFYKYAFTAPYEMANENSNNEFLNIKRHYITPIYQMPLFKQLGYDQHQCPTCEEVEKNIVLAWFKNPV